MNEPKRVSVWLVVAFAVVAAIVIYDVAQADDEHCHGNCPSGDVVIGVETGNVLDIGGDRAYAIGGSSFDVDINQCMASKATNIVMIGWQTLKENPTCIADGLDARGNHDAAARVRCTHVETIRDLYGDFTQCVAAVTMPARNTDPPKAMTDVNDDDEDEHWKARLVALETSRAADARSASQFAVIQRQQNNDDALYARQLIDKIQKIEEPANDL